MRGWAIVALVALPCLADAQTVRGTVSEKSSSRPMAGAVVFLLDANQSVVARDLTTESGSYRLTAPRSGAYRVRTMRIGFRPALSDQFLLGVGEDLTLPLAIENVPVTLNAVRVERRANCPTAADVTPAYNAWNEVATALNAALLSSRLRGTSATIVNYDRWTEPGSEKVLRQGANVRHGMPGMPWRSISADSLHRVGFVVRDASGWYTFHAVDLDVLLSDTFLEDHCLQLSGVDNGEIAIEFAPSRDRGKLSEIRGFVWLSASTLELKRLQFRYVNILREYEEADAGGELEFMKLRNGSWIISRWQVRMPTSFQEQKSDSYGRFNAPRATVRASEVKTTGGDLLRVVNAGDTLFSVPARNFEGKVLDSATNSPVPGARVVIRGTSYSTVTNEFGRFRIDDVLPGAYEVRVFAPHLDSLATFYQAPVLFVVHVPNVEIRLPTREQFIGRWCPDALRSAREAGLPGLVVGFVRNLRDSTPVNNAEVVVEWRESTLGQLGAVITNRTVRTRTDANGVYRACGPAVDQPLRVTTSFDGDQPPLETRIGASRVLRLDFWLSDRARR